MTFVRCCFSMLLLAVLVPFTVSAQEFDSLTVRVLDKETSVPFTDTDVALYENDVLFGTRTTDANGYAGFSFDITTSVDRDATGLTQQQLAAYPNPFSGLTTVPFTLEYSGNLTVAVYDVLGNRVLENRQIMGPGNHSFYVNLSGLSSGTYFLRSALDGVPFGTTTLSHTSGTSFGRSALSIQQGTSSGPFRSKPAGGTFTVRISVDGYIDFEQVVTVEGDVMVTAELEKVPVEPTTVPEFGTDETRKLTVIATGNDGLDVPRDLAFNPVRPTELWTVNRAFDGTVILFDAGTDNQVIEVRADAYGNHFMEEVSAIAMGDNGLFGTTQESLNRYNNQVPIDQANLFMGPALWTTDLDIYAQVYQNHPTLLGSHMDMLHESPLTMGMAHEVDNVFWVFDGFYGNIVRYDFREDHGPGEHDHSNGIVRRYYEAEVKRVANVPGHLIMDKVNGILYICDTGNKRILSLDTRTGNVTGFGNIDGSQQEPLVEYSRVGNVTIKELVTSGLERPCGIELHNNRLFVTDNQTGDIVAYSLQGEELGRIETNASSIMGITIGPEGKLWYVDASKDQVVRVDP